MYNFLIRAAVVALTATIFSTAVSAQSTTGLNPVYRRAQALVNDGNGAAGRALVDSMIGIAGPGTNEYAEGVYWRAVLAATAAEAEMDYRRVVVDYPLSPRVEDALIRLAQLDVSRANYDGALRHLDRLVADHPNGTSRPRAAYWMARVFFEKNDIQRACIASSDALARTSENDAELRNQITYLNQRCAGVVIATAPVASPVVGPVTQSDSVTGSAGATTNSAVPRDLPPVTTTVGATTARTNPAGSAGPVSERPIAKPATAEPAAVNPVVPSARPTTVTTRSSGDGDSDFSVQVAAYNVKSQATTMATKLRKDGYEARVSGTKAPFRVRIGRYATQAQATAVQRSLKAKQITGFVVQAEPR